MKKQENLIKIMREAARIKSRADSIKRDCISYDESWAISDADSIVKSAQAIIDIIK